MDITTVWDFVENYYPDYTRCQVIARNDDLHKICDGELNGEARYLFNKEFNVYGKVPVNFDGDLDKNDRDYYGQELSQANIAKEQSDAYIYEKAIEGFIKESQTRIDGGWSTLDIIILAKDNYGRNIQEDDALVIKDRIQDNHDASIGINWDVIDFYVKEYLDELEAEV